MPFWLSFWTFIKYQGLCVGSDALIGYIPPSSSECFVPVGYLERLHFFKELEKLQNVNQNIISLMSNLVIWPSKLSCSSSSCPHLSSRIFPQAIRSQFFLQVLWLIIAGYMHVYNYQAKEHLGQDSLIDQGISFHAEKANSRCRQNSSPVTLEIPGKRPQGNVKPQVLEAYIYYKLL